MLKNLVIDKIGERFVVYDVVSVCWFCGRELTADDSIDVCFACEDVFEREKEA